MEVVKLNRQRGSDPPKWAMELVEKLISLNRDCGLYISVDDWKHWDEVLSLVRGVPDITLPKLRRYINMCVRMKALWVQDGRKGLSKSGIFLKRLYDGRVLAWKDDSRIFRLKFERAKLTDRRKQRGLEGLDGM